MKQGKESSFTKIAPIASFVLAMSGVICVLALFYFIYYHLWSGQRSSTTSIEFVLHYVLPATLAVLFLGSLAANPVWRINLALTLFSTGVSLLAINLFLAVYDTTVVAPNRTLDGSNERDIRDVVKLAKKFGVEYDARGRLEVIDDLHRRGIKAVPRVAPVNVLKDQQDGTRRSVIRLDGVEVLPHGGISNSTTVYCNENGQYVIYQSDEHGFHNPKGLWGRPIEIMAVGDSFTQGACVPSDKNFVALIRKRSPGILNLGAGGNGPLTELAALLEYLEILRPKIVLWFFFEGNDVWDLHRERKSPLLMRYLAGNFRQALLNRQAEIDQELRSFLSTERDRFDFTFPAKPKQFEETLRESGSLLLRGVTLSYLRERLSSNGLVPADYQSDPRTRAAMELLPSVLGRAKSSADALGSKLYFVYLPQRERYLNAGTSDDSRDRVLSIAKKLSIPIIDVHAAFQDHADPLDLFPFRRGYHYNERGHQLVSEMVLRYLAH
jgi:lysophospholipase L1-like esterase